MGLGLSPRQELPQHHYYYHDILITKSHSLRGTAFLNDVLLQQTSSPEIPFEFNPSDSTKSFHPI